MEAHERRGGGLAAHAVCHGLRRERPVLHDRRHGADAIQKIAKPLVEALLRPDEESGRIKRTILEVLAKAKAPLGERASAVAAALVGTLSDYKVENGIVKQR